MTLKDTLALSLGCLLLAPHAAAAVHVPEEVKKCVVFLYGENPDGTTSACTGFFVGVPNTKTEGRIFVYLVTARHCLQELKVGPVYRRIFVRMNLRTGDSTLERVPLTESGLAKNVFFHKEPGVDLAVIPLGLNVTKLDARVLPLELFPDESAFESLGIGEGTDVFFTGLFLPYRGARRNYPIVRFGRVALVTPEPIEWRKGLSSRMYLMETTAFGGNSGSPAFFYLGPDSKPNELRFGSKFLLAGVVTFAFQDTETVAVSSSPPEPPNVGVTGVVPSAFLKEILLSDELRGFRGERPLPTPESP